MNHTYCTYGNILRIIDTYARYIALLNFCNPNGTATDEAAEDTEKLRNTEYYGVNAAFFNASTDKKILNIAMQNGVAVGTTATDGTVNEIGSSAIGWTGYTTRYFDNVTSASDINFSSSNNTWVQGGIGMWLGSTAWKSKVSAQPGATQYLTGSDRRTAMVLNSTNNRIYLIVADEAVTFEEFRTQIQDFLDISDVSEEANTTYKAIMLDGGRSSQMRAQNGDSVVNVPVLNLDILNLRGVPQVITTT